MSFFGDSFPIRPTGNNAVNCSERPYLCTHTARSTSSYCTNAVGTTLYLHNTSPIRLLWQQPTNPLGASHPAASLLFRCVPKSQT
jgi:hypothetical protein